MFYESELRLLRQTFRKCRIQTAIAELDRPLPDITADAIVTFASNLLDPVHPLSDYLPAMEPEVLYRLQDPLGSRYLCLLLPELPRQAVLILGPFLSAPISGAQLLEWAEDAGIPPARLPELTDYYNNIPLLPDASHLFVLLESFCEWLWGNDRFRVEDVDQSAAPILLLEPKAPADGQSQQWKIHTLEQRYAYENQLMDAVAKGQAHKAGQLFSNMSSFFFEQRASDALRNVKNYCIIMNTILRKAAERGGVHPVYLDRTSSAYAVRIEQVASTDAALALMTEMFQGYCQLVRSATTRNYSAPVQRALLYIEANLSEDLHLQTLADKLNVSAGYLSALFRKETQQTLTDYVNRRRVDYARHLLTTTRLQIQTIAQHCGIVDVQYFTKVFKRITGTTPRAYRQSN